MSKPDQESEIKQLIRKRASSWERRAEKWHKKLDSERAWVWRGKAIPILIGALGTAAVAAKLPYPALWPFISTVIAALVNYRASSAAMNLEVGKFESIWVIADRLAEWYRGQIAVSSTDKETLLFERSQVIENSARLGLSDSMVNLLNKSGEAK